MEALHSAAVKSFCPACGTPVDNPEVACASCFVSRASFPWDAVGQTVFIGSARETHDKSGHAQKAFICVRCAAPDGAGDTEAVDTLIVPRLVVRAGTVHRLETVVAGTGSPS